jgi:hypothetical protein
MLPYLVPGEEPYDPLMSLDDIKALMCVSSANNEYDTQITFALGVASSLIRSNTGRILTAGTFTDEFRPPHTYNYHHGKPYLALSEFPISSITTITVNGVDIDLTGLKMRRGTGIIFPPSCSTSDEVDVEYEAGYTTLPHDLQSVVLDLTRKQLNAMGVDMSKVTSQNPDTTPLKSVSIGALRVEYAASVTAASVSGNPLGPLAETALDEYETILRMYRHPRMMAAVAA